MSQIFLYILNEMVACSFFFHLLAAVASQVQMVLKVIVESISVDKDALTSVGQVSILFWSILPG